MGRRLFLRAGAVWVGVVGSGCYVWGCVDEGVGRSQTFWGKAFPLFLRYRWVQFLNRDLGVMSDAEASRRYERLHEWCAPCAKDIALSLRGFYLKQAQMMSTRSDFIPEAYLSWMRETQDAVPTPFAPGEAEAIVEEELGRPLLEIFREFDTVPCGTASIGQVHKATLRSGERVAVKIQHTRSEHLFRSDIQTCKQFCELAMPQHVPALEEIEKQFLTEFDYCREAQSLDKVYKNVMPTWSHKVAVPKPYLHLCTKNVLTMEFIEGVKLVDGVKSKFQKMASQMGTTLEELEKEQRRKLESGELQLRGAAEEARATRRLQLFLRVRDYCYNYLRCLYNLTPLALIFGMKRLQWSELPINLGEIMQTLTDVHGDELFRHGIFNGDPHPGNILLMPDGRLGLIDYGQTKELPVKERLPLARLIVALSKDAKDEVARICRDELKSASKYGDVEIAWRLSAFWFDRDTDDIMTIDGKVLNIADFLDYCESRDPIKSMPSYIIMPGRMIIMLRSMALAFGVRMRMAKMLEPWAQQLLDQNGGYSIPEPASA